jgi:Uncharacterized oxidoreductases, Fe-dependent alcohol dehydrogenase family
MTSFTYQNPTKLIFGAGKIAALSREVAAGTRVLLLSGGGSITRNGVREAVHAALAGCEIVEFAGIEPNPRYETILKAADIVRKERVHLILGVGGGSVADAAKFLGAVAADDSAEPWDNLVSGHFPPNPVPVGIVLTLPATGSESNSVSVINFDARGLKLPFSSPTLYPRFAILDPATTESLPVNQRANGVVDAFSHVLEQYLVNPGNTPVQFGYSEVLMRTLIKQGPALLESNSLATRETVMFAANQALNGLIGTGVKQDWSSHMIGHAITALYGIDHACTLSAVMGSVFRHGIGTKRAMLEQCGRNVFGLPAETPDLAEATIQAIEAFFKRMGMPIRTSQFAQPVEIEKVIEHLEAAKQLPLGENGTTDAAAVRAILMLAASA